MHFDLYQNIYRNLEAYYSFPTLVTIWLGWTVTSARSAVLTSAQIGLSCGLYVLKFAWYSRVCKYQGATTRLKIMCASGTWGLKKDLLCILSLVWYQEFWLLLQLILSTQLSPDTCPITSTSIHLWLTVQSNPIRKMASEYSYRDGKLNFRSHNTSQNTATNSYESLLICSLCDNHIF